MDGTPVRKQSEFEDADVRIDFPRKSPDRKWLLFDRFKPKEGFLGGGDRYAKGSPVS
jgi:hypothetical protein